VNQSSPRFLQRWHGASLSLLLTIVVLVVSVQNGDASTVGQCSGEQCSRNHFGAAGDNATTADWPQQLAVSQLKNWDCQMFQHASLQESICCSTSQMSKLKQLNHCSI